jgi:ribosomal protein S12 methylthiotransferase
VPSRLKAQRQKKLLGIQRKISKAHQAALVGRTLDVLVEGVSEETSLLLEGRWMGQAPEIDGKVYVNRGTASPGEIVRVEIEQAGDYDLVGGIVGSEGPSGLAGNGGAGFTRNGRRPQAAASNVQAARPRPRFPILSH